MAEQLAAANAAFRELEKTFPEADYASFISGWNACLKYNEGED